MSKPLKQTFHTTDIKRNVMEIQFITKYIPTKNNLISWIHIKDKSTSMKNTALTFLQIFLQILSYKQSGTETPETTSSLYL